MSSEYVRRNVTIKGHRTSISLEKSIWDGLEDIRQREGMNFNQICTFIDGLRDGASRSSAMRTFILNYFRAVAGHHEKNVPSDKPKLGAEIDKLLQRPSTS